MSRSSMRHVAYLRLSIYKVATKLGQVSSSTMPGCLEFHLLAFTPLTKQRKGPAFKKRQYIAWVMQGLCLGLLSACATYHPLPLPEDVDTAQTMDQLRGGPKADVPLDMAEVEKLVLVNNPDLRAARMQRDVAKAQMLQAGLFPNPVINGSAGYLMSGVGDATAWTAGISEDIQSLITLSPRRQSAKATTAQVDASLLWQEWQTVGKARLLVVDLVEGERLRALQQSSVDLMDEGSAQLKRSTAEGNIDAAAASPLLLATSEARASLNDLQRRLLAQHQELAALLGLPADANIPLKPDLELSALDSEAIKNSAANIQRRRPDLIALQLGYQSQEANLRAAVLAQFPRLSLGYEASQDNSRVRNGGPAITLDLPIFDRNQGNIAIAKATREQLRAEYIVRLNSARQEIRAALSQELQLNEQLATLKSRLPDSIRSADEAASAWKQGLIDTRTYLDLANAAQSQQIAAISLEQAKAEQHVALDTLLGTGMPSSLTQDAVTP